jgi:hypothetical protein
MPFTTSTATHYGTLTTSPFDDTMVILLTAADAMLVCAAEAAEKSATQAQIYLTLAERYRAQGEALLEKSLFADAKKAGGSRGMRDVTGDAHGGVSDDFALEHDLAWR